MFLNALMLVGLSAAALPLVLHLLSRSRYKTVDWGAMMFLDGVDANQQRHSRLNQWLLLAVRMAIIALLAIALARPVLRGRFANPGEGQRVIAVVLLDCSASAAFDENGHTRMVLARAAAKQVLAAHKGDRVSLVLMGRQQAAGERQPTSDLWDVARRIDAVEPGFGQADVAQSLSEALDIVESLDRPVAADRADKPDRPGGERRDRPFVRFYVVADRQASSWRDVDAQFAAAWRQRLDRAGLASRLAVIPVGNADADNVAVESVELLNAPAVIHQAAEIEVRLRNHGAVQWASLPLTVSGDGRVLLDQKVNLAPESVATIRVPVKEGFFAEPGTHVISAEVNRQPGEREKGAGAGASASPRPSGFSNDDRLDTVVEVIEPIRVLVISGDERGGLGNSMGDGGAGGSGGAASSAGDFRGEADYLNLALAPFKATKRKGPDLAAVDVASAETWAGPTVLMPRRGGSGGSDSPGREARLGGYQVIVLANIERFTAAQVRAIEQFVYDGGGLLVAPGNLARYQDYNDGLFRSGVGILPAALKEPTPDDGSAATSLSGFDARHPIFRFLAGRPDPFLAAAVVRYFPTEPPPAGTQKLGFYVSGDPFLLESHRPRGVLLLTTSVDADWTTLPLTSFYLPFLQSTVRYLADTSVRKPNLLPGQPIEVTFDEPGQNRTVQVTTPDKVGKRVDPLRRGELAMARFTETDQPGQYQVRVTDPPKRPYTLHFVVRAARDESDLTPLSPDRWAELERLMDVEKLDPAERPLTPANVTAAGVHELWVWALGGVMGLAIIEMLMARRWSKDPATDDDVPEGASPG